MNQFSRALGVIDVSHVSGKSQCSGNERINYQECLTAQKQATVARIMNLNVEPACSVADNRSKNSLGTIEHKARSDLKKNGINLTLDNLFACCVG